MYLALGTNFPDALSVSALASKNSSFVILHSNSEVKAPTMNLVTQNRNSINKIYVIGGPQLITSTALNILRIKL